SHHDGWFGVPADNFIGWMLVVFTFSFLFRYFSRTSNDMINKTTRTEYYFLLPAFAYLSMMVLFSLINLAETALKLSRYQELFIFWVMVMIFAAVLRKPDDGTHPPVLTSNNITIFAVLFTRLLFFAYIIWSVVLMELHLESRTIIVILLLSLVIEILIYAEVFTDKRPKRIYTGDLARY
ncbi:carotenoid biosynthesis protein, partial [Candidatus Woesearchaeota archaeon]|nr:carotenoid biosynthesis protein [Candidatus Woesearchaeota archaeon]